MKNSLINVAIFTAGAVIGSAVTWKLLKIKYEKIAQEEIDSVKETFFKKEIIKEETDDEEEEVVDKEEEPVETPATKYEKPNLFEYASKLEENGYINYSTITKKDEDEKEAPPVEEVDYDKPYIIEDDEFGDYDDYETTYLTYFAGDKILADNYGEIVDDIDDIIGYNVIEEFDKYNADVIYVRNDRLTSDYEVVLEEGKYRDVYGR